MVEKDEEKNIKIIQYILNNSEEYIVPDSLENEEVIFGTISNEEIGINFDVFETLMTELQNKGFIRIDKMENYRSEEYVAVNTIEYSVLNKQLLEEYCLKIINHYPKRLCPLIREKVLNLIAHEIGEMDSGTNLIRFLENCNIPRELIVYPNTKWIMIYDILEYLTYSEKEEDEKILFKIIEESVHPLTHNGYKDIANKFQKRFNELLEFDGFILQNYQIKRTGRENEKETKEDDKDEAQEKSKENKKFWISFNNRSIILNDKYPVTKRLQFNRPNEIVFGYIYKNPNKTIEKEVLQNTVDKKLDLNRFVSNLGFKGELRKCFFDVSKTSIRFTNPLTQRILEERNINISELDRQIKELGDNIG